MNYCLEIMLDNVMSVVLTYEAVSVDSQKYVLLPIIKNSFGNVQPSTEYVD